MFYKKAEAARHLPDCCYVVWRVTVLVAVCGAGHDILESMSWWEIMMSIRAWCLGADNTTRAVNEISRSLLTAERGITRVEMGVRLFLLDLGYWLFHSTFSRHMRNRPCVATTQLPFLLELFPAWRWGVLWLLQYSPYSKCTLAH